MTPKVPKINYICENLLESESDRIEFMTSREPIKGFEIYQKYRKEIVLNYLKELEELEENKEEE